MTGQDSQDIFNNGAGGGSNNHLPGSTEYWRHKEGEDHKKWRDGKLAELASWRPPVTSISTPSSRAHPDTSSSLRRGGGRKEFEQPQALARSASFSSSASDFGGVGDFFESIFGLIGWCFKWTFKIGGVVLVGALVLMFFNDKPKQTTAPAGTGQSVQTPPTVAEAAPSTPAPVPATNLSTQKDEASQTERQRSVSDILSPASGAPPVPDSVAKTSEAAKSMDTPTDRVAEAPAVSNVTPAKASSTTTSVYTARHSGSNGCNGQLTLSDVELRFDCPSDNSRNFAVLTGEAKIDHNGIQRLTQKREKYHFEISGMTKHEVQQLLADWLDRASRF